MVRHLIVEGSSASSSGDSHNSNDNSSERALPIRPKGAVFTPSDSVTSLIDDDAPPSFKPTVEIHPLPSKEGIIVKIKPPLKPLGEMMERTPCDIVLAIDVSGSMDSKAPVPCEPGETPEDNGLTVLDLTKHAAKTILKTLGPRDRLGIVTFSSQVNVSAIFSLHGAQGS